MAPHPCLPAGPEPTWYRAGMLTLPPGEERMDWRVYLGYPKGWRYIIG